MAFKLGYRPSPEDKRDVKASDVYGALALPKPPSKTSWGDKLPAKLPMWANDRLGDCAVVTTAQMLANWSAQHGTPEFMDESEVIAAYNKVNGGRDQGSNPRDVLELFRGKKENGRSSIGGHRIARYARLDNSIEQIELTTWAFGGCYIAVHLPRNYQDFDSWSDTNPRFKPDMNAGHALPVVGYGDKEFTLLTWGQKVKASYAWVEKYIETGESWLLFSADWWNGKAIAPSGLAIAEANAVFKGIAK